LSIVTRPQIRTYTASDGYRLHYRHWEPAGTARATIVALHGIQSHSGWFSHSSGRLAEAGFEVFFLDRRGSGMNEPARGHVVHYERLIYDVVQCLGEIRNRNPTRCREPVILMGVSWGGKLATVTAARQPDLIDGLALLYPGLRARFSPRWDQNLRLSLAKRMGVRDTRIRVPLDDPALFTAQPHWQEVIRTDPLALHEVTVSFLLANRDLDRELPECPAAIHCSALVMLAGKDDIIDNSATTAYVRQIATPDLSQIDYPDARHTLEFEPDRDRFIDDLIGWLGRIRIRGAPDDAHFPSRTDKK
jgi:alpha-beta hydrolase superfamily lysophospholipase